MERRKNINELVRGIVIMTTFSVFYAMIEVGIYWNPTQGILSVLHNSMANQYFYRFLYTCIFLYPAYLSSRKLLSIKTVWYTIYGFLVEDLFYWLLTLQIPYSWSWYYPVYYGVPIPDLLEFLILLLLFLRIRI